jgi:hypothetical protein
MGRFAPFLATIQALSKKCVFLFNKRSKGCFFIGRTSTGARTNYFHNCPFQLSFSWESNPGRVKASERGAKCYPRGDY